MRIFRKVLRYWIAIASVLSFMGGWVILAHSPKPVQPVTVQSAALPTLPPIQAFGDVNNNNGSGFFSTNSQASPPSGTGFPRMRTGGS